MAYTAQDIEKYFSGKLTVQQMHAMEKAALDDSFLAEAMEGYGAMTEKEWEKQLALAHKQLAEAGTGAKVVPMRYSTGRWWKAAAAVLVIGVGTALTVILTKNKTEEKTTPQIAKADNNITVPAPATKDNTNMSPAKDPVVVKPINPAVADEKKAETNADVAQTSPQARLDDNFVTKPGRMQAADSIKLQMNDLARSKNAGVVTTSPAKAEENVSFAAETKTTNSNQALAKTYDADAETLKRKSANANNGYYYKNEKAQNNFFNAQVVAADNSPLPFSNISVKSGKFETYADVKGNFRLFSTDSLLTVEIRSVGYEPRTYSLRSNQATNKITLQENEEALKDKMENQAGDVGLNGKIRRASVLSDSAINVEPKDGWDNYNTYVANNLDITDEMLKNEFHGEVEVSFDVKANGTISNIRINKSLGPAYDEAAKRLIMQGPQWKVKKGRKTSASVKVKF